MRDCSELELIAQAAVGFSDVSLAPDVVLELIAENKVLKAKTETYCTYGDEGSEHTYYGDQAAIAALTALVFELEALRGAASHD